MPTAVEFFLPTLPPSKNALRIRTKQGVARSDKYRKWLADFGWEMHTQKIRRVSGPYKLTVAAVRPDKQRRDLANLLEALSDALHLSNVTDDDAKAESISLRWVTPVVAFDKGIHVRVETAEVAHAA